MAVIEDYHEVENDIFGWVEEVDSEHGDLQGRLEEVIVQEEVLVVFALELVGQVEICIVAREEIVFFKRAINVAVVSFDKPPHLVILYVFFIIGLGVASDVVVGQKLVIIIVINLRTVFPLVDSFGQF